MKKTNYITLIIGVLLTVVGVVVSPGPEAPPLPTVPLPAVQWFLP